MSDKFSKKLNGEAKYLAERKKRIDELRKQRFAEKPLIQTKKQRLSQLDRIYDGLLYLWEELILTGCSKGTGAVSYQLERARLEIEALGGKDALQAIDKKHSIGWDYKKEADSAEA